MLGMKYTDLVSGLIFIFTRPINSALHLLLSICSVMDFVAYDPGRRPILPLEITDQMLWLALSLSFLPYLDKSLWRRFHELGDKKVKASEKIITSFAEDFHIWMTKGRSVLLPAFLFVRGFQTGCNWLQIVILHYCFALPVGWEIDVGLPFLSILTYSFRNFWMFSIGQRKGRSDLFPRPFCADIRIFLSTATSQGGSGANWTTIPSSGIFASSSCRFSPFFDFYFPFQRIFLDYCHRQHCTFYRLDLFLVH